VNAALVVAAAAGLVAAGCSESSAEVVTAGDLLRIEETRGSTAWAMCIMGFLFSLGAIDHLREHRKKSPGKAALALLQMPLSLALMGPGLTARSLEIDGRTRSARRFHRTLGVAWNVESAASGSILHVVTRKRDIKRKVSLVPFAYVGVVTADGRALEVDGSGEFVSRAPAAAEEAARRLGVPLIRN
jgi:hypothetical protein